MRLLPLLVSLYLPLCATQGATGIAAPGVVDFSHLHLKGHSEALVAPPGFSPPPDIIAPAYPIAAPALFAALQAVAAAQPRNYPLDIEPQAMQAAWVIRSAAFNFPDIVEIAVIAEGPDKSSFIFYSRSVYGWFAYGVNLGRARTWIQSLDMKVNQ